MLLNLESRRCDSLSPESLSLKNLSRKLYLSDFGSSFSAGGLFDLSAGSDCLLKVLAEANEVFGGPRTMSSGTANKLDKHATCFKSGGTYQYSTFERYGGSRRDLTFD
jgi:hypothetical protein